MGDLCSRPVGEALPRGGRFVSASLQPEGGGGEVEQGSRAGFSPSSDSKPRSVQFPQVIT